MHLFGGSFYLVTIFIVNLLAPVPAGETVLSHQGWPQPAFPFPTPARSHAPRQWPLDGAATQAGGDKETHFPMKICSEVGQMDLWYKPLIRAARLFDLSGDQRCVLRACGLTCSYALQTISWAPFRIHPEHAAFGGPAFILREKNQQFSRKYSQLADGKGWVVASIEPDPMLR